MTPTDIQIRRAYDRPGRGDGFRVLVDRVWPRGVSKQALDLDAWRKEIAPSTRLRQWFGHDPEKWSTFRARYFQELQKNRAAVEQLMAHVRQGTVTLLYGAKDREHNDAVALKEFLTSDGVHA